MKTNFISSLLILSGLFFSTSANAWFGTNWHEKKIYCNKIEDVQERIRCDSVWDRLQKESKLSKDKADFETCGKIFDYIKEIKPKASWDLAISCLELISYRREIKMPKEQKELCEWLLEKGKSVPRYVFCLQEYDSATLKVCDYPRSIKSYAHVGNCLKHIHGINFSTADVKLLTEGCLKTPVDGRSLRVRSATDWDLCLEQVTEKYRGDAIVNFETGAFQGTGR